MGEHKNKFKLITSRELADLIDQMVCQRICLHHLEKCGDADPDGTIKPVLEELEITRRKLADALKALYPPGGVAVYGKNDSPKL